MKTNIFEHLKMLISSNEDQLFIQDNDGNLSPIQAGKIGRIVRKSSKSDLNQEIFSKERIGLDEIKSLEMIDFDGLKYDLIRVLYNNLTYNLKKEAQTELKDIINKYNLPLIRERKRAEQFEEKEV